MADPRDVEAAREWVEEQGEFYMTPTTKPRYFVDVTAQLPERLASLLTAAREQERQACEQIVREANRACYMEGEPMDWGGGRDSLFREILRRIRERAQSPAPASQEGQK